MMINPLASTIELKFSFVLLSQLATFSSFAWSFT